MSAQNFNPYVGLRPFHADENLLFFGRDQQTLELLQRLHEHRFVAVVGGSGSGKSSLIRAGLIPALKGGYLVEDSSKWLIATMKPGQSPLFNLAKTILSQVGSKTSNESISELVKNLKRERTSAILNLIAPLRKEKNANFFLLIDQFEELFRFSMEHKDPTKKTEAIDFVNLILNLSKQKVIPFYVVLTMRSDFIGDCAQFRHLPESMNKSQYLVPRITRQQLKKIIEGPARLYGGKFNPAMTTRLINDLSKVKDELPLVQHALMRMWDHEVNINKSGELDFEDYHQIGGIEKALSIHADEASEGMSAIDIGIAKEMFQALTAIDENGRKIRRPLLLSDLKVLTGASEEKLLGIIDNFIRDRRSFLIVENAGESEDKVIDISHESLIRQWHTLNVWVEEEHDAASYYLQLADATQLHQLDKKDFLTGSELALALEWRDRFNPTAVWANRYREGFDESIAYLEASEKERDRLLLLERSRRRKTRILAAAIMGLILLFGIFAISSSISIREQKAELEITNKSLNSANEEIKNTVAAEVKARKSADSSKLIAQDKTEIANAAKRAADSSLTIAIEQEKLAIDARELATIEAANAKDQERIARDQKNKAQILYNYADSLWTDADQKKEAFEMYFQAKVLAEKDPTMALRLYEEAINKYPYHDFKSAALTLINNQAFYSSMVNFDTIKTTNIISMDISPVDESTLMGYGHGVIRKWDKNRNKIFELKADSGIGRPVSDLKFSPDGKSFLSVTTGYGTTLWNSDGTKQHHFSGFTGSAFSPDGSFTVTGGPINTLIIERDGTVIKQLKHPKSNSLPETIAVSQNGNYVFLGYSNYNKGILWNLETDRSTEFSGHVRDIIASTFSDDGKFILTGSKDGSARLWDLKGNIIDEFKGQWTDIRSVAIASDGSTVLTGGSDGSVRLWQNSGEDSGKMIKEFIGHRASVNKVMYTKDGRSIITGSLDETVRRWKIEEVIVTKLRNHEVAVRSVAFSPDGNYLLTGAYKHAYLWGTKGNLIRKTEPQGNIMIYSVDFAPDGKSFITGSDDGIVREWDLEGELKNEISAHDGLISSVAYSPDGNYILSGSLSGWAKVWNIDGTEYSFIKEDEPIISANFSPDSKFILTGSHDGVPKLWDLQGKLIEKFVAHQDNILAVAFAPDGKSILTGSSDHTARLWSLEDGWSREFKGPRGAVISVAFSHDGKSIATGHAGGAARIWDLEGNIIAEYQGTEKTVFSVAFSPDYKYLLTGAATMGYLRKIINLQDFLTSDIDPLSKFIKVIRDKR